MKKKTITLALLIAALILFIVFQLAKPREASMLLVNGVVYTVNERQPVAEAVAIREGRIIGVGSTREIQSSFSAAKVIDLKGKAVYPGFIDSHAHLEELGAFLANLDLEGTTSVEGIQSLVAERSRATPKGGWVRGRGWDQNLWTQKSFPDHRMLDDVAPDIPVYLVRVDGHAVWVNRKVLDLAHISRSTADPDGGKILRDAQGEPTGVFVDNAIETLNTVLPPPTEAERTVAIERAVQECIRVGLTEVHDMGTDLEGIAIYKNLAHAGKLPFRIYVAVDGLREAWNHYLESGPEVDSCGGRLTVRALKLYADGALGSRGAALVAPYNDDPGNRGLTLISSGVLESAARKALHAGFQVCVHAIGDRANTIVLDAYEDVLKSDPGKARDARFRIEHAQVLDSADVSRFHSLGVIPSMQPTHCTSDMGLVDDRIGPERARWAYAWRSLLNTGCVIPGGSDFPVESPNPILGFYAAITRQDRSGRPPGGWHSNERMTREEALKSFTLWGAFAAFQEHEKGSIEVGKWADLVVLSDDIMKAEPLKIPGVTVEVNIVAGDVVYAADGFTGATQTVETPGGAKSR